MTTTETKFMWVAGWNMPGYLPDDDVHEFDTWAEAKEFMREELARMEDDPRQLQAELLYAQRDLEAEEGPTWDRLLGNYVMWIDVTAD